MKMKKEYIARGLGIAQKADSATNVGNKVLPITGPAQSSSTNNSERCHNVEYSKKEKTKGDKPKTLSWMTELLKRAAAAKAQQRGNYNGRKVLLFKNRVALKAVPDSVLGGMWKAAPPLPLSTRRFLQWLLR